MLLGNFPVCCATNIREAEESIHQGAAGSTFYLPGKEKTFLFRVNHAQFDGVGIVAASCDVSCLLDWTPAAYCRQSFQIAERSVATFDGMSKNSTPSAGGYIAPAGSRLKIENSAGYESLTLRVDNETLASKLSALLGEDVKFPFFDCRVDSRGKTTALQASVFDFASELTRIGTIASSPVLVELAQATIIKLLIYQKHDYTNRIFQAEMTPSRKQLERVVDYISAHWDQPLTIESFAKVSGIGSRTMVRLFRKEMGCSPTAYTKQLRLQHARNMLLASNGEESVISVALRCGFHSFGHFARDYKLLFGQLPSETLRSSHRYYTKANIPMPLATHGNN